MTVAAGARETRGRGEVPVAPLRELLEATGMSPTDVAAAAGWKRPSGIPDGPRVTRTLGMRPYYNSHQPGVPRVQIEVTYDTAVTLARAMGADPVDMGL